MEDFHKEFCIPACRGADYDALEKETAPTVSRTLILTADLVLIAKELLDV